MKDTMANEDMELRGRIALLEMTVTAILWDAITEEGEEGRARVERIMQMIEDTLDYGSKQGDAEIPAAIQHFAELEANIQSAIMMAAPKDSSPH